MSIILKWCKVDSLKANPGKSQFIIPGNHQRNFVTLKVNSIEIRETNKVVLLDIPIDNKLTFNEKKRFIFRTVKKFWKAFIISQFNYAPKNWVLCRKI